MFNLKQDGLRDESVSNVVYREYRSETSPTDLDKNINLNIRDTSEWLNMSEAYLEIRGKTKQGASETLGADTTVPLCVEAGGGTSIFESSRLRVANTLVESNDVYSHYTSFIKQLVNSCDDYHKSVGLSTGFNIDRLNTTDDTGNNNLGAQIRQGLMPRVKSGAGTDIAPYSVAESQATFYVPLRHFFSYFTCKKVMKGVQYRIELVRRELSDYILHSATTGQGIFSLNKVSLWVPVVQPSLTVRASLENMVSNGATIPWSYMNYQTYASDSTAELQRRWTYNTQSDKPMGAFLFCKHKRTGTQQNYNNMIFDHSKATSVQLLVNGSRYPYQKYEMKYDSDIDTSRVYAGLMEYMGKNQSESETGSLIDILNHRALFPLYYFNLHNLEETQAGYQLSVELDREDASEMRMYLVVISEKSYTIELNTENVQVVQK